MFELILNTIRETIQKAKLEIINEIKLAASRDNAEIRCDLLEIKGILKRLSASEINTSSIVNNGINNPFVKARKDFKKNFLGS